MRRSSLRRFVPRPSYANVIATIALFIALGGAAVAAGLPKNSVGVKQLKRGAVTPAKIRKNAITAGKIAPGAVTPGKLGANAVLPGNLGNGIISTEKIAAGAVIAATIKNGVITNNKLANGSVNTQKLADNAVNASKLADKSVTPAKLSFATTPAGTVSPLASGQTLRGMFALGSGSTATVAGELAKAGVSYYSPLANPATVTVLLPGQSTANCAGLGAGNSTPAATAGNLCVYVTEASNLADAAPGEGLVADATANTRLGFGLTAKAKEKEKPFFAIGQWAVTAP